MLHEIMIVFFDSLSILIACIGVIVFFTIGLYKIFFKKKDIVREYYVRKLTDDDSYEENCDLEGLHYVICGIIMCVIVLILLIL